MAIAGSTLMAPDMLLRPGKAISFLLRVLALLGHCKGQVTYEVVIVRLSRFDIYSLSIHLHGGLVVDVKKSQAALYIHIGEQLGTVSKPPLTMKNNIIIRLPPFLTHRYGMSLL